MMSYYSAVYPQSMVDKDIWALSIIRKENKNHAYIILEGLKDNEPIAWEAHLFDSGVDTVQPKAGILFEVMDDDKLYYVSKECNCMSWDFEANRFEELKNIIEIYQQSAEIKEINYQVYGDAITVGAVGGSLETFGSEDSRNNSVNNSNNSVSQYALRKGHNCYSWAVEVVSKLSFEVPQHWTGFFVSDPKRQIIGRKKVDNESQKCIIS